MIKVLVPTREIREVETNPPLWGVRKTYLQKLYHYNLVPLFVTPGMSQEMLEELYGMSRGLLLTGGEDVDPSYYGQEKHETTQFDTYGRDQLEITLSKIFLADKKPILGICRGCQVLAVAAGGTLFQHVPDVNKTEIHSGPSMIENEPHHTIRLIPGTRIHEIIQKDEISVNSFHHQAVENPGSEMVASGFSPGGIVESIEHQDKKYFCLAVQCHPENETGDLEKIFVKFRDACSG